MYQFAMYVVQLNTIQSLVQIPERFHSRLPYVVQDLDVVYNWDMKLIYSFQNGSYWRIIYRVQYYRCSQRP